MLHAINDHCLSRFQRLEPKQMKQNVNINGIQSREFVKFCGRVKAFLNVGRVIYGKFNFLRYVAVRRHL
jgi:hypothetical protein